VKERPGPHVFVADPDLPPDHTGRQVCLRCHLVGEVRDAHHDMPDIPEQAEARRWAGEREEE
jgi:hypothetical protein